MKLRKYLMAAPLVACLACGKDPSGASNIRVESSTMLAAESAVDPAAEKKESTTGAFRFGDDEAGKVLAKILTPISIPWLAPPTPKGPTERALPSNIAAPEATGVAATTVPPRYPVPRRTDFRPSPLAERVPLDLARATIEAPDRIGMPEGASTKLPTPDVKMPAALPYLARPSVDRASFDDPTTDFTSASIINDKLPLRATEAAFVRVNLPDPFENAAAVKVKIEVKDDPLTALGNPPPPSRP